MFYSEDVETLAQVAKRINMMDVSFGEALSSLV